MPSRLGTLPGPQILRDMAINQLSSRDIIHPYSPASRATAVKSPAAPKLPEISWASSFSIHAPSTLFMYTMQQDLACACPCPSHPYSSKPCINELPPEAPDADDMMCSGIQSPKPAVTQCLSPRLQFAPSRTALDSSQRNACVGKSLHPTHFHVGES